MIPLNQHFSVCGLEVLHQNFLRDGENAGQGLYHQPPESEILDMAQVARIKRYFT